MKSDCPGGSKPHKIFEIPDTPRHVKVSAARAPMSAWAATVYVHLPALVAALSHDTSLVMADAYCASVFLCDADYCAVWLAGCVARGWSGALLRHHPVKALRCACNCVICIWLRSFRDARHRSWLPRVLCLPVC